MSDKRPPFFFDPEPITTQTPQPTVGSGVFFEALTQAGVVQASDQYAMPVKIDGQMKEKSTAYLSVEFGFYKDDYAFHLSPCHDRKNLDTAIKVERAIVATLQILKPLIPDTMRIDVFLPREDWKMKVISITVRGAAKAWNFSPDEMEKAVTPIFDAVQRIILG